MSFIPDEIQEALDISVRSIHVATPYEDSLQELVYLATLRNSRDIVNRRVLVIDCDPHGELTRSYGALPKPPIMPGKFLPYTTKDLFTQSPRYIDADGNDCCRIENTIPPMTLYNSDDDFTFDFIACNGDLEDIETELELDLCKNMDELDSTALQVSLTVTLIEMINHHHYTDIFFSVGDPTNIISKYVLSMTEQLTLVYNFEPFAAYAATNKDVRDGAPHELIDFPLRKTGDLLSTLAELVHVQDSDITIDTVLLNSTLDTTVPTRRLKDRAEENLKLLNETALQLLAATCIAHGWAPAEVVLLK